MEKNINVTPNPENSSVIQALLDIRLAGGCSPVDIDIIIGSLRSNERALKEADRIFRSHLYPDHKLTFCKLDCEVEIARFLSPNALAILIAMCQNMRHKNLIQLSHRDILTISTIKSLRSVGPAIKELLACGCIAEKIPGTTRRATVYMVNPLIATVGSKATYLTKQFWELTGTKDEAGQPVTYSEPHKKWKDLTKKRTYGRGYSSLETDTDDNPVYFSRITEPKIKLAKKTFKNEQPAENAVPEPEDGIDETLPFDD